VQVAHFGPLARTFWVSAIRQVIWLSPEISTLYGGKVARPIWIRFDTEALRSSSERRQIVTAPKGKVKMQGQINHYFSFRGRFRNLPGPFLGG